MLALTCCAALGQKNRKYPLTFYFSEKKGVKNTYFGKKIFEKFASELN